MEVEAMVRPVVEAAGLELVDAGLTSERGRRIVRVTVERAGDDSPLDLDTIASVSERISRRLDLEGFEPRGGAYTLEVSSPGVERPLRSPRDFERRVGERVRLRATRPIEGGRTLSGEIVAVSDREVVIATAAGERAVPFADISSARTVFEWGPRGRMGRGAAGAKKVHRT